MRNISETAFRSVLPGLFLLSLVSCSPKQKVVDESYPDGSPRHECWYKGTGEKRVLLKETFYYSNGQVEMTGAYKDGERDGYWIYYYENGNVWSEGFYHNGKNDGKRLTYYENGRLRYEAYYKDNERTGVWKFYDQAGNLIKEVDYTKRADTPDDSPLPEYPVQ
ncbi:MAG: toxin-antitoxin system YwqK family antitoxin [Bacteroidales bacterium]|nr:toxin-antitoxin system YwqK family antitoxin [Bacteroidales bacterium]